MSTNILTLINYAFKILSACSSRCFELTIQGLISAWVMCHTSLYIIHNIYKLFFFNIYIFCFQGQRNKCWVLFPIHLGALFFPKNPTVWSHCALNTTEDKWQAASTTWLPGVVWCLWCHVLLPNRWCGPGHSYCPTSSPPPWFDPCWQIGVIVEAYEDMPKASQHINHPTNATSNNISSYDAINQNNVSDLIS